MVSIILWTGFYRVRKPFFSPCPPKIVFFTLLRCPDIYSSFSIFWLYFCPFLSFLYIYFTLDFNFSVVLGLSSFSFTFFLLFFPLIFSLKLDQPLKEIYSWSSFLFLDVNILAFTSFQYLGLCTRIFKKKPKVLPQENESIPICWSSLLPLRGQSSVG